MKINRIKKVPMFDVKNHHYKSGTICFSGFADDGREILQRDLSRAEATALKNALEAALRRIGRKK